MMTAAFRRLRAAAPARRLLALAALAVLATAGACAFSGLGALNALAALRGHQAGTGLAYGPLARQRFDLYRPPAGAVAGASPLVVFVHGGTWSEGGRADYRFAGEALAAQGFTVMVIDYRLYPDVRYPDFLQDCARAVAHALEHAAELGADPRRVFLYGHSAGAYNAAMLALDPRWLGAAGHRPDELAGWIGLAGPYDFLPITNPRTRLVFDWPRTAPDTQPIRHVDDLAAPLPVFLGAARQDTTVRPAKNTQPLAARLRARGGSVVEKLYDRVDHATLVGALGFPLTPLAPVLADSAAFIRATPPARPAGGG
jgi:acetyl esterase/lipase